jgi:hypothetical protein
VNLPDFLPPETWADWCEYREQDVKGGNWSERAQRAFLRQCERLHAEGFDVPACIDFAMQAGWLSVYGRDNCKRKQRHRETTVTDLRIVETSDKETAAAALAAMRQKAKKG